MVEVLVEAVEANSSSMAEVEQDDRAVVQVCVVVPGQVWASRTMERTCPVHTSPAVELYRSRLR